MSDLRVGIFAGVFDPVHLGHTYFIDRSIKDKKLDKLYVLIERTPKYKDCQASYGHRLAMLKLALTDIPKAEVYEGKSDFFPITSNLPDIKKANARARFFLLVGEDVAGHIADWDDPDGSLAGVELIVAKREKGEPFSEASSLKIRKKLLNDQLAELDDAVADYIDKNRLYTIN